MAESGIDGSVAGTVGRCCCCTAADFPRHTVKYWSRNADLHRIDQPTLITYGEHDELGEPCALEIEAGIPHAAVLRFEESAHMPHIEQAEAYRNAVESFLAR